MIDIAIDIGSSYTSIFVSGNGVVLHEPTLVAYISGKVLAVGEAAQNMKGKTPDKTTIVAPVTDGVISDFAACNIMLVDFFNRILPDSYFPPKARIICAIPTGLTSDQRHIYEDCIMQAHKRIKEVVLVESVILAGIGVGLPVASVAGGLIADIGGGATEVAALSMAGIIAGCGLNLGGDHMDKTIADSVLVKTKTKLGLGVVKRVKEQIASLFDNDMAEKQVGGLDSITKALTTVTISASDLYDILYPYYDRVGNAIDSILTMCPPDAAAELNRNGVYLVGGGAKIPGLAQMLSNKLGMRITIVADPEFATISGAGRLLGDRELLKKILMQK